MDFAEQIAGRVVAANAVVVRIAPAAGAPDIAGCVSAHAVGDVGLWHFGNTLPFDTWPPSWSTSKSLFSSGENAMPLGSTKSSRTIYVIDTGYTDGANNPSHIRVFHFDIAAPLAGR